MYLYCVICSIWHIHYEHYLYVCMMYMECTCHNELLAMHQALLAGSHVYMYTMDIWYPWMYTMTNIYYRAWQETLKPLRTSRSPYTGGNLKSPYGFYNVISVFIHVYAQFGLFSFRYGGSLTQPPFHRKGLCEASGEGLVKGHKASQSL